MTKDDADAREKTVADTARNKFESAEGAVDTMRDHARSVRDTQSRAQSSLTSWRYRAERMMRFFKNPLG